MSSDVPALSPAPFKNRRGWLVAFGVIEILIACLCLFLCAFMSVGLVATVRRAPSGAFPQLLAALSVMSVLVCGGLVILFLVLGVGSIQCKNWARIGTQIVSIFWLFTGIFATLSLAFVAPDLERQQPKIPPEHFRRAFIGVDLFTVVAMVLLPATLLVFYSFPSVRATCLGRGLRPTSTTSPTEQAASELPLSVTLLALWECLGVVSVIGLFMMRATVVFGVVVRGPAAIVLMTANAALSGIAAYLVYRRDYLGWAISLFRNSFWAVSWCFTLLSRNLIDVNREMGLPEPQLQQFRQFPHFQPIFSILGIAGFVPYLILIVYTKRFFTRASTGAE